MSRVDDVDEVLSYVVIQRLWALAFSMLFSIPIHPDSFLLWFYRFQTVLTRSLSNGFSRVSLLLLWRELVSLRRRLFVLARFNLIWQSLHKTTRGNPYNLTPFLLCCLFHSLIFCLCFLFSKHQLWIIVSSYHSALSSVKWESHPNAFSTMQSFFMLWSYYFAQLISLTWIIFDWIIWFFFGSWNCELF